MFINLIRATDNTGKNIYLAKYKANEPYFYVPWDLDGCFGTIWDGTYENITNDILSNGLISRVMDLNTANILSHISQKWYNYRTNILSDESLSKLITEQYNFLNENKIYEREALIYPNYMFQKQDLSYTLSWLGNRLDYLDIYFGNFTDYFDQNEHIIFPNPAKNWINISSSKSLTGNDFKIYNNLGQLVIEGIIEGNTISIEQLKNGFHVIELDKQRKRFVKQQ